ncbi:hypothetical protein SBOR_6815 [Sclerotinia borealis F-4128]|uniref:Zn(2)-C6 fungal-type domain-containing protein n=1 Tax=Sclerotinia borealis (strain F-4128) TaxID=1432307 RepID=W9CDD1_SCLBF|nr:hypothetical protein SBOR_6815 [Sclerotinia borealis F-4128]
MPPRRSHKKSKAGCQRCKHRKIKCDEKHPLCGNCQKHGVSCDFGENSSSPDSSTSQPSTLLYQNSEDSIINFSSPASTSSSIMPFYSSPTEMIRTRVDPVFDRSLELKLMHHYTATTSKTLSNDESQDVAWSINVPSLAYDSPFLMDAILAVSALHLRILQPEDRSLVRASHSYMASALAQYSSLLNQGPSECNAEALFCTAALIAFQASASRCVENAIDSDSENGYVLPLAWFHSFQGVKTVVITSWQWLRNSQKIFPIINGQPPLLLDLDPERRGFFAPLLEGIEHGSTSDNASLDADSKQACEHAVAMLNWAHQKPERARIVGFAATVSRRYIELMREQDPRALVIAACFFAMTRIVDDIWWLQGVAKREVTGIFSLLPEEWWPKMDWPMRIAHFEGKLDEDTWGFCWHTDSEGTSKPEERSNGNLISHIDMLAQILNQTAPPPD